MKTTLFKSIVILLITISSGSLISQELVEIDNRLESGYNIEYLQNLQLKSPSTLRLLNFDLDYSWFIAGDEINSKVSNMEYLYYKDPETQQKTDILVQDIDLDNINIAEFYFERDYDAQMFYKIWNSDIIIGFYSVLENAKRYNNIIN